MYDLFVPKGGRQNKNYHFWFEGTTSGNFSIFQFVPGKKRVCAHCLAQFSRPGTFCATRWSPKQKWEFLVQGNHIRQFPNFLVCADEKRVLCALPCTIFVCKIFRYHETVAKTKIIIFGPGEPYQAISEIFGKRLILTKFYNFFGEQPFFLSSCRSSLGVEHSLSKRKVVGSNPACGFFFGLFSSFCKRKKKKEKKSKIGFNTTLFPGGPPPQYWAGSNRVNFGVRMRTGALRLIWSNPKVSKRSWVLELALDFWQTTKQYSSLEFVIPCSLVG